MEAPDGAAMTETVIETGLEATIGQIIPIQVNISDEFELRFPELSRAELGYFNFRAETELKLFLEVLSNLQISTSFMIILNQFNSVS